ncbi:SusC/RagA family TonB-linked outer membrane protein [Chryseolinea lacunae]|uniref:TonB-dependent receptor n=1 Tax=Chryseolinea lacunae TaxID=2801331 RepID=A0ABS1KUA6_9BACT|nr:SusC/RagA family TonB-linked outer membrane protein [Chryseolinea lacunae]MBL0743041.1 TonB-dependent receptor [Chryseolinea lacunae]
MRVTLIHGLLLTGCLSFAYAGSVIGQGVLEKKISVKIENTTLRKALNQIGEAANVTFLFQSHLIAATEKVTIQASQEKLGDVLNTILISKNIKYDVDGDHIILTKKATASNRTLPDAEPDLYAATYSLQIQGAIADETGLALPGVNVIEKGTTNGTTSDNEGKYSINVKDEDAVLVFSFIGYSPKEIRVGSQLQINVALEPDSQTLNEVVVVGYGDVKQRDLTGAVSSVKSKEIVATGVSNVGLALQGRAAGVNVTSNSGVPGGGVTVRIRGTGSINSGNDPLYVVDGIQLGAGPNAITFLNPSDIERIEVLKDASAAAIYGAQGANGVVMITTKRGKTGAPRVTFDSFVGVKMLRESIQPAGSAEFGTTYLLSKKAAGATVNDIVDYYKPYYPLLDGVDLTKDYSAVQDNIYNQLQKANPNSTKWADKLYQKGVVQNYNVSISGGNDSFKYLTSVSYYNESGIVRATDFDRLSFRYNTDYKVSDKIKVGVNLNLVNSTRKGINPLYDATTTGGLNFSSDNSLLSQAFQIDPLTTVTRTPQDTELAGGNPGNPYDLYSPSLFTGTPNPVAGLARTNLKYSQFQLFGNGFIEYSILKDLVFKTNIGINMTRGLEKNSLPNYFISGQDRRQVNSTSRSNDASNTWNWINQLTYSKNFGKHAVSLVGAIDALHNQAETVLASAQGLPSNNANVQFLNLATSGPAVGEQYYESKLLSYVGRLNYNYADKYLLTASIRRDGSSKFTRDYRWGTFSSFSAAYRISEESFFRDVSVISDLKIRAGWGQLGNSAVPAYITQSLYNSSRHITYPFSASGPFPGGDPSGYPYQTLWQGILPGTIGTPDLTWETQEQTNFGIDLALFQDRFKLTADYYIRTSKDNLLRVTTPLNAGYGDLQPWSNLGKIENRGVEFYASYTNKVGGLTYSLSGNLGVNKNKVISLGEEDNKILGYSYRFSGIPTVTEAGRSIGEFIGFKTDGIFQTQEEVDAHKSSDGVLMQPNARPGDFRFKDVNADGVLNDDDRVVIGSALPKFSYGYSLNLEYKGIELSMFFQGQYGNKILMYEKFFSYRGQGTNNIVEGLVASSWHGPGTSNAQPRISANDPNDNFRMSDYYLENGSYMRLKSLQLGYNFPSAVTSSIKMSNLKVYVSGENLLTFTSYPGIEPELGVKGFQQTGVSSYEYAQPKTYRAGIVANF